MAAQPRATITGGDIGTPTGRATSGTALNGLLNKLQARAPNSTQLIGFFTLVVSGAILLLLTGLTLTATLLTLTLLTPVVLLTSPIWIPVGGLLLLGLAGFLSTFGFGVAALAGGGWMYKYFRGRQPPGAGRVDYARNRIVNHVRDYAREYGGYLHGRVKDAAPGA